MNEMKKNIIKTSYKEKKTEKLERKWTNFIQTKRRRKQTQTPKKKRS